MSESVTDAKTAWGDLMNKKKIIMAIMLLLVVLAAGCTQQSAGTGATTIKSQDDVGKAITNVSTSIGSVSDILDDIDSKIK